MADNVTADSGSGGATFAAAQLTFSGDTAIVPIASAGILSGSEGSWSFTLLVGGAGAVGAGVQRVTLASDDPAVATLGGVSDAAATQGSTGSISAKLRTVTGQLNTIAAGIPVTNAGTFAVQAAQSGTWTVTGAGGSFPVTDSSGSLTVDAPVGTPIFVRISDGGSAVDTLPVSLASVPSHAVTNAGTFAVQVSSALPAGTNNIGDVDVLSIAAGDNNIGNVDIVTVPSDPFGANADAASATGSISAKLRFIASTGIPVTGTVTVGSHAVTNAGTFAVQVDGNALTSLQLLDDVIFTDDGGFTPGTSKVAVVGAQADEGSTDSVDEGDAGALRMTLDRKLYVTPSPHTAGGLSIFRTLDLDETEEDVKTAAGQVYGWYFFNASTSIRYLKFYNATAANVTVGSTTPVLTFPLPAASSGGVGGNVLGAHGIAFDTAICVAATTGLADADTGAPSANDVILNVFYK